MGPQKEVIDRWNLSEKVGEDRVQKNIIVWWNEVRPTVKPKAVEWDFELPLVVDQKPEIWLRGTVDCVQEHGMPVLDWKNPSRKPDNFSNSDLKKWSVQAAAYTWATVTSGMAAENTGFEFVHLVKGEVHRTVTDYGPVEWASLVALARSAGTLIAADLPVWPLRMEGGTVHQSGAGHGTHAVAGLRDQIHGTNCKEKHHGN